VRSASFVWSLFCVVLSQSVVVALDGSDVETTAAVSGTSALYAGSFSRFSST
jgi:hypothetical protein